MADIKFDQFTAGGEMKVGDIPVGLRSSDLTKNFQFDFPGTGIKDADGNYLFRYATAGSAAVNYPVLTNSLTGQSVKLSAQGSDGDINIELIPKGNGFLILDGVNWPNADGTNGQILATDGAGQLDWITVPGLIFPSTDMAIARFDGAFGALQNSGVILNNLNAISGVTQLDVDNIRIDLNTISSTNTNGDLSLVPNGTGNLILDLLKWPQADGLAGQAIVTNGLGQLAFAAVPIVTVPTVDMTIARFDGVAGALEDSGVTISDTDVVSGITQLNVDNIRIDGNTISSTNTDGNIDLDLNGNGFFQINTTQGIDEIINDGTLATATANNLASALAIKNYVDSTASGNTFLAAVVAASTVAYTATYNNGVSGIGATLTNADTLAQFSVDGLSPVAGSRILIKNQSNDAQNGVYVVTVEGDAITPWVLTRSTDFDEITEIVPGVVIPVNLGGTLNGGTSWLQTAIVSVIGTSPINFIQYTASFPLSLANGGTGANLTAANGGILYSGASALAILAPAANSMLVTDGSNVPSMVAFTGSGAPVRATSPTLVTPLLGTPTSGTLTNCVGLPITTGVSGLGANVATFLATPNSANLAAAVTDETGTGVLVFNNTPTFISPLLGTPTSGTLTNCVGLPINTGVSGLGANVATFLATPTSANLAAAVTDETGTGSLVFNNSPTFITPVLGTPSSGTLTNCTGLPIAGLTGLGTGVAAALAANVTGSGGIVLANSPTLVTPALGTPASGVLTNCTGLPLASITGLGTGVATFLATPSSANLAAAVTDETGSGALVFATSPTLVTPALGTPSSGTLTNCVGLPVAGGGTGNSTFTAYSVICAGTTATGAFQNVSGLGSSGQVLTSNGAGALPTWQAGGGGGSGVPIGTMIDYGGTSLPTDYLACDGSAVSRATYASLFTAIGTTWGAGNGTTTFNVPNFQRKTAVGSGGSGTGTLGNAVGNTGGTETNALSSSAQNAAHTHTYTYPAVTMAGSAPNAINAGSISAGGVTGSTGSGSSFNIIQPSNVVLKCIKYQ